MTAAPHSVPRLPPCAGGASAGAPAAAPPRGAVLRLLDGGGRYGGGGRQYRGAPVPAAGEVRRQPGHTRLTGGAAQGGRTAGCAAPGGLGGVGGAGGRGWLGDLGSGVQCGEPPAEAGAGWVGCGACARGIWQALLSAPPDNNLFADVLCGCALCRCRWRLRWRTCTATAWRTWTSSQTTSTCKTCQRRRRQLQQLLEAATVEEGEAAAAAGAAARGCVTSWGILGRPRGWT